MRDTESETTVDLRALFAGWQRLNAEGGPEADAALRTLVKAATPAPGADPLTQARQELAALPASAGERAIRDAATRIKLQLPPEAPGPLPGQELPAQDPPEREWLVRGWLPAGRLSSIYGPGGAGKSRLALQIAAAVMSGGHPLALSPRMSDENLLEYGAMCTHRDGGQRVLWLSWEDERDEFVRRWRSAWRAGAVRAPFPDELLTYVDMREFGGALWAPTGAGHVANAGSWTEAGKRFLETMPGNQLAIVDPIAGAFASSENDRALVRAFCAALDGQAEAAGCAVVLIGHPPKDAGQGYSGSTDWRNAVRSMLVLETADAAPDPDDERRKLGAWRLRLDKASYAHDGAEIWLARECSHDPDGGLRLAWLAGSVDEAVESHNAGTVQERREQLRNPDRLHV